MTAILGLLSGRQHLFVEKMSKLVLRDTNDSEQNSGDEHKSTKDEMLPIIKMMESPNKVDKRFSDLYKFRTAKQSVETQ